jgi:hypothetical protein
MLILLLAFMPVAVFAQYNQSSQGTYGGYGGQSYSDMINGKTPKPERYNKVRENYERNLEKRHIQRVDRGDLKSTFIPKGMWMCGTTVNYREWENENQNLLVLKNLNMEGHTLSVSPYVGYFVARNLAVGVRYNYGRNYFYLGDLDVNLGEDFNVNLEDLYYLEHKHEASLFMRNYIPLFGSKIFGAFAEVRATYSHANGKNSTGRRDLDNDINTLDGTYETVQKVQLGVSPGLCVFVTDFMAVETTIGVLGVDYKWSKFKNIHPYSTEYEYGKSHSGGANFKFNIFSIHLGITFYL